MWEPLFGRGVVVAWLCWVCGWSMLVQCTVGGGCGGGERGTQGEMAIKYEGVVGAQLTHVYVYVYVCVFVFCMFVLCAWISYGCLLVNFEVWCPSHSIYQGIYIRKRVLSFISIVSSCLMVGRYLCTVCRACCFAISPR